MLETELEVDKPVTDVEVVIPFVIGEVEETLLLTIEFIDPEEIAEEVNTPVVVKKVEVTPLVELVLLKTKVEVARPLEVKLDDTGAVVADDEVLTIAVVPESLAEVAAGLLTEATDVVAVSWELVEENPEVEVDCCVLVSEALELGTLLNLEEDC